MRGTMKTLQRTATLLFAFNGLALAAEAPVYPFDFQYEGNPLVRHYRSADPDCHVWNDKLWVYTSQDHDAPKGTMGYSKMDGYHVLSTSDLKTWTDHGEILHSRDVSWGREDGGWMWAPGAAYKDGTYYLYYPHHDKNNEWRIGVATSDKPQGPFKDIGHYIEGTFGIDPMAFIDDDGTAYLYFERKVAKLKPNMMELAEAPREIDYGANHRKSSHEDMVEAPWVYKKDGLYYFSYSNYKNKKYQAFYGVSKSPYGPFEWKGALNPKPPGAQDHHCIVEFKDQWYYLYHVGNFTNAKGEKGRFNRRNVAIEFLHHNADGTMKMVEQTAQGIATEKPSKAN